MSKNKLKICPKCLSYFEESSIRCPLCKTLNFKYLFSCIFFGLALILILFFILNRFGLLTVESFISNKYISKIFRSFSMHEFHKKDNIMSNTNGLSKTFIEQINLRPMSELSYLTKNKILEMRKKFVRESVVFGDRYYYEPNKYVYRIEDNLPWISALQITKYGIKNNPDIGDGVSRHSLSINNPELMFTFIINDYSKRPVDFASEADYMLPSNAVWDKAHNSINVKFGISDFFEKNPQSDFVFVQLDDTNARDLGYGWAYCENYDNVVFFNDVQNVSLNVYPLQGFYHKGYACGLESGCNNYSPSQVQLQMFIRKYGMLKFKLWKDKPVSKMDKPDLTYVMIW